MTEPPKVGSIVVGIDDSFHSQPALEWAAHEAELRGVPLHILHANTPPIGTWPVAPMPTGYVDWQLKLGREVLHDAEQIAGKVTRGAVPVTTKFVVATPSAALTEASKDAGMVVVGSRGKGALSRVVLGSVSAGLAHHAHCPVVIVHDEGQPPAADAPILLGFDGSPASQSAIALAFDEASRRGAGLVAMHAWWSPGAFEMPGFDWEILRPEVNRQIKEMLAIWEQRYPEVAVERVVVADRPAQQLAERSPLCQLVIVGSHGRGAVTGALLGSVSNAVVHAVKVPVIIARPE